MAVVSSSHVRAWRMAMPQHAASRRFFTDAMPTYRCAWPDLRLSRWLVGGYFLTYCINTLAAGRVGPGEREG